MLSGASPSSLLPHRLLCCLPQGEAPRKKIRAAERSGKTSGVAEQSKHKRGGAGQGEGGREGTGWSGRRQQLTATSFLQQLTATTDSNSLQLASRDQALGSRTRAER